LVLWDLIFEVFVLVSNYGYKSNSEEIRNFCSLEDVNLSSNTLNVLLYAFYDKVCIIKESDVADI